MNKTVFIYSGEGTHGPESKNRLLKHSTLWPQIEAILTSKLDLDIEQLWDREIGNHRCPYSPLLTAITQICLADLWQQWGYRPDILVGHSTGELAAAYQSGLYALEDILQLAYRIGQVASRLDGAMIHGTLSDAEIDGLSVNLSSYNFEVEGGKHVTLSGYADQIDGFVQEHPSFVKMRLPHPWHHPDYGRFADQLPIIHSDEVKTGAFISGVTKKFETRLKDDHWNQWLVSPIDFIHTVQEIKARYKDDALDIIEIGFHPALEKCCQIFKTYTHVSSMYRGEDEIKWIVYQRKKLNQEVFHKKLAAVITAVKPQLDYDTPLAYQGFDSLAFANLSMELQPFFPTLAPQDFYRYKTINQLVDNFGAAETIQRTNGRNFQRNEVAIAGMSCRFPSSVETIPQFWDMLQSQTDQVHLENGRGGTEAGYLNDSVTRFDHQYFDIPAAEARTMDPQQILALELSEMLWSDAQIDPQKLDKKRVGVYMGVWSQEYRGDRSSVFYPTGTNPSIIASRVSYQYDLRGPSWVSNTACSSSLVAIHYAVKDIEAGRVDYAIAGGVNMILDEVFTDNMRNSGFLSSDNRCKSFDDRANGYVRAEGGGLVLLANKSLVDKYYATLAGTAINQNGRRSQLITAPHPQAQEELIVDACQDAGLEPKEIAYVECHGTGTKIGDPIEISAIQNTIARGKKETCYIGSVKSTIGHLESAAGIAGLIKSVAILNHGIIPSHLQFNQPNTYIDFDAHGIRVVTEATRIDRQAAVGVSSFGFGGSNAHIIVKGVDASRRKPIRPIQVPFNRDNTHSIGNYVRLLAEDATTSTDETAPIDQPQDDQITREAIDLFVGTLFFELTNIQEIDPQMEMIDQGLDSMSGTELVAQLETAFKIDIDPDILFEYPLKDQFVDQVYHLTKA